VTLAVLVLIYLFLFLAYNHYSNNLLIATAICYFYVTRDIAKHREEYLDVRETEKLMDGGKELFLLSMFVAAML
jgi:hypothetical protein